MNKKFSLLSGAIFIVTAGSLIHSCSKDSILSDKSNYTAVSSDLIATAKSWHTAQTQISGTLSISTGKKAYVLPPMWKEARLQQQSNGTSVIIVPSPDAGIDPTSTRGLVRKNDNGTYTYFDPALGTYMCRPASDFFDLVPITLSKDN